jgi:hyperosmotically inducible protein
MKRKFSYLLLSLGFIAFVAASTGCKSEPKDGTIKTDVENALKANPDMSTVMVDVNDGVATLTGEVKDANTQSSASSVAGGVKGVKSVQNNLTVSAPPPPPVEITADDPLTRGVTDATKDFPGVSATVNDGVITVTGETTAANWRRLKMALDGLKPKKVDAAGLKINK